MMLVPTIESKLFTHWQGPYEVIEAVGPVNYKIRQPDRRKTEQIYHINLLKCEALVAASINKNKQSRKKKASIKVQLGDLRPNSINVGPDLSEKQVQEVNDLVANYMDVFSTLPGRTSVTQHKIVNPSWSQSEGASI